MTVVAIHVGTHAGGALESVAQARARAGRGLEGDYGHPYRRMPVPLTALSALGRDASFQMKLLRQEPEGRLLALRDVERRLPAITRRHLGVQTIPLADVVGTEGRAATFTRDFEPRHESSRHRIRALAEAFPSGDFPPIVAVKLGDVYFVVDGHHRVALARRSGAEMIDAVVTEFVTLVPLPAGADMLEVVLRQLERVFLEDSGLAEARPGLRLSASRPALYLELLENLQVHGYHLMREHDRVLSKERVAEDWYENVFAPAVAASVRERVHKSLRDAPDADFFLLLHQRRRDAFPSSGCPRLAETSEAFEVPPRRGIVGALTRLPVSGYSTSSKTRKPATTAT